MVASPAVLAARVRKGVGEFLSDPGEWLLLTGDRMVIAGVLTAGFGLLGAWLTVTGLVTPGDNGRLIYLYQVLIGGNITLVTIVLSINQLVLSREMNTPGELRDQIENVIDYRNHVEETAHTATVPVTPAAFLKVLLEGARESAQRFGGVVVEQEDDRLVAEADRLVTELSEYADHISGVLEQSQGGIFSALAVTLETNYSRELNEARRIRSAYATELSQPTVAVLEELIDSLKQIDVARQYFKSIYIQSELARLSRILLYVGVPAVGSAMLAFLVASGSGPRRVSMGMTAPVVVGVVTLGFSPLAVLFSFVLRVATVAQRTVAITPFTVQAQELEREH